MGYQTTLDRKGVQTLETGKSQRKQKNLSRWKKKMCNIIYTSDVTRNNGLKFQRLLEHHPFQGKGRHVEHPLIKHC
jgi:hypothetical protein